MSGNSGAWDGIWSEEYARASGPVNEEVTDRRRGLVIAVLRESRSLRPVPSDQEEADAILSRLDVDWAAQEPALINAVERKLSTRYGLRAAYSRWKDGE